MHDPYKALAPVYDAMADSPDIRTFYGEWRTALLAAARARGVRVRTLVDLACGTGNSTVPWAGRRGMAVWGVDRSAAMLAVARRKSDAVRWVRGDITKLHLGVQADAVTCQFDALNHLLTLGDFGRACAGAAAVLRAGGLFQFDLNTIHMLRWLNGREKLFRVKDAVFTATNVFDASSGIATFRQIWFVPRGRLYERLDIEVQERAFSDAEVRGTLAKAGFRLEAMTVQRRIGGKPVRKLYLAVKR